MAGRSYPGPFGLQANEWVFDQYSLIWKIAYNPEFGETPSCISVFTRNRISHGHVQRVLDVLFPVSMGRDGADAPGDSHSDLHGWIQEDYRLADIHPHDHFIIPATFQDTRLAINPAVYALINMNYINTRPAYDVIQFLQKGR